MMLPCLLLSLLLASAATSPAGPTDPPAPSAHTGPGDPTNPIGPPAPVDPARFDLAHGIDAMPPASLDPQVRDEWSRRSPSTYRPSPWYLALTGGFTTTRTSRDQDVSIDFDDGYLLGAALGYRFGALPPAVGQASWAAELEFVWTDQDLDATGTGPIALMGSSDLTVFAIYFNAILDVLLTRQFGLYGGAGLGVAWTDFGGLVDDPFDFTDESGPFLTWQLKAGLRWLAGERVSLRFGYRFLNVDDVELDDSLSDARFDLETRQHVIELGVVFGF